MNETAFIRPARRQDLAALTEIYNQAIRDGRCTCDTAEFTEAERLPWLQSHEDPAYPLFVAECDGVPAGYAYLTSYRGGRPAVRGLAEVSYYVDFRFHGRGLGTRLLERAMEAARSLGYRDLVAILLSCNEQSIRLLRKHGFSEWGCLPDVAELPGGRCSHLYYGIHL